MRCIAPRATDTDLWILMWEELQYSPSRRDIGGGRARQRHTAQRKCYECRSSKSSSLKAKDGGGMAHVRAITVRARKRRGFCSIAMGSSFHCLVEERMDCEALRPKPKRSGPLKIKKWTQKRHRTKWCAAAKKHRCVGCGRSRKHKKMQGTCGGPRWL